jgi:hypothetical protein
MLPENDIRIENAFPQLAITGYKITSPATNSYNCIAWTAKDNSRFWWPGDDYGYYWPDNVDRGETMENFIKAFNSLGFEICENADFEKDFEKISIYANNKGVPVHGARMLDEKTWTSKLGSEFDISHTINGLDGDIYGTPRIFMKKKVV